MDLHNGIQVYLNHVLETLGVILCNLVTLNLAHWLEAFVTNPEEEQELTMTSFKKWMEQGNILATKNNHMFAMTECVENIHQSGPSQSTLS